MSLAVPSPSPATTIAAAALLSYILDERGTIFHDVVILLPIRPSTTPTSTTTTLTLVRPPATTASPAGFTGSAREQLDQQRFQLDVRIVSHGHQVTVQLRRDLERELAIEGLGQKWRGTMLALLFQILQLRGEFFFKLPQSCLASIGDNLRPWNLRHLGSVTDLGLIAFTLHQWRDNNPVLFHLFTLSLDAPECRPLSTILHSLSIGAKL